MEKYKVDWPEGQVGRWKIEHFTVAGKEASLERMRAAFCGGRYTPVGTYTRLMRGGTLVMSDTPDEIRDCREPIWRARGNCLVNGLGLGVVVQAMLMKPEVTHVTVIEIAPEVLKLVGTHLKQCFGERIDFVLANALTWKAPKGTRYECIWHDIWDNICGDNRDTMSTLHRKYGRRADWQGSWCRHLI